MKRYVTIIGFLCVTACGHSRDATSSAGTWCSPDNECRSCGSCMEECRCGGGTQIRCESECAPDATSVSSDAGEESVVSPYTSTLIADAFDIPPGQEAVRCQNFKNPFGRDVAVQKVESFMTSGSHHMFVFIGGNEDGPLVACSGLTFGPNLHLTQRSHDSTRFPKGVGRILNATDGIQLQIHYLNASDVAVHTEISATLNATLPENVPTLASGVFINTVSISVPPFSKGTVKNSCTVPKDIEVFEAASHMHQHGVHFTARASDGQLLYDTDQWAEPPPWTFTPPRRLKAGSTIDIQCNYQNTTAVSLSFGESAASNEMCIFSGGYYPALPGENITCLF